MRRSPGRKVRAPLHLPDALTITSEGVTTTYARSVSGNIATMTVTDAASHATTIVSDLAKGRLPR